MAPEDPELEHRIGGTEFLLATRIRYEVNSRRSKDAATLHEQQAELLAAAPERDEAQDLRAAEFLVATRAAREATERTLTQAAEAQQRERCDAPPV